MGELAQFREIHAIVPSNLGNGTFVKARLHGKKEKISMTLRLEEQGRDAKDGREYVKKPKETRREVLCEALYQTTKRGGVD